jgi:flagellum-specific ATP synthase
MPDALLDAIRAADLCARAGRVAQVRGLSVEVDGLPTYVGERCTIARGDADAPLSAEVVGFSGTRAVLMPYGSTAGLAMGAPVVATGRSFQARVGASLLGRVIDAFGQPLDGRSAPEDLRERDCLASPPDAMRRGRTGGRMETGVKAIDGLLSLAQGQRVGLFAGSGVGKSTLLGMLAKGSTASVNVIALIGERGREVREFVEDQLGAQALERSVVVVATADQPALLRLRAAYVATAIAEHFRDEGQDVLLMMDSLTRFAMARREIGLAAGEPPTARGYTPSVFSEISQLCERGGPGADGSCISAIYTVLVDGDDFNEPITDAIRATLDGHVVLSRDLANAGQYPAIDVLASVSRLFGSVNSDAEQAVARRIVAALALYHRNRALLDVGAYKPNVNPRLDTVVKAWPKLQSFLTQSSDKLEHSKDTLQQMQALAEELGAPA